MSEPQSNMILFTGYAKLPSNITAGELYKVVGVVVVIDMEREMITEADCTLATELARRYASEAMLGYNLRNGIEPLLRHIDQIYQGSAKKAIITALRVIHDKYRSYKEGNISSALD